METGFYKATLRFINIKALLLLFCSSYAFADFVHPGLLLTESDFTRIKSKIEKKAEPWLSAWQGADGLINDGNSSLGQSPAPLESLIRGGDGSNFGRIISQIRSMYALALRWKISGDDAYGDSVVSFMNAWSSTLKEVTGNNDRFLASGLYGYELANIGEMMRSYDGWAADDMKAFQAMLVTLFYPLNHDFLTRHNGACISNYWANWDLANVASMMSIGVFADRQDIYDEALSYLYQGEGNGALKNLVYYRHPGNMGQYQESGRDQGHSTLGMSLMGVIAKTAFNQGVDLFSYNNYAILAATEYVAKYNLNEEVPYTAYGPNCTGAITYQTVVSDNGRGILRPSWELLYNYYENVLGIAAPWTKQMAAKTRSEKYGNGDELGWGTLTESREPLTTVSMPKGLTADVNTNSVSLSWWGAVEATEYNIKRASSPLGYFSTIATVSASDDLTYKDANVNSGQTYYYYVTSLSSNGESMASSMVGAEVGPRLYLHLSFDEADDSTVDSDVGESKARLMNGASLGEGIHGKAVVLDGEDDYVILPENAVVGLSDYTILFWFKQDGGRVWAKIFDISKGDQQYLTFWPKSNLNTSRFATTKISSYGEDRVDIGSLSSGKWFHIAIAVSGETAKLYVDGVESGSSQNVRFNPKQLGELNSNWLGRSHVDSHPYFKGAIDDFRIYSGALSSAQINGIVDWDLDAMVSIPKHSSAAFLEDGTYRVISHSADTVLATKTDATTGKMVIGQEFYSGTANQQWTLTYLGDGKYKVLSKNGSSIDSDVKQEGRAIELSEYYGSASQLWNFTLTGDGYYRISSESTSATVLSVDDATDVLVMNAYTGDASQKWELVKVE